MNRSQLIFLTGLVVALPHTLTARHFYQPHTTILARHPSSKLQKRSEIHAYAAPYTRSAHRAFKNNHGFKTHTLSGLYFGSDEFRLSHLFKDSIADLDTRHYTPYVRVLKMRPRVQYSECGTNLGLSTQLFTRNHKMRFGMRVEVPVIRRELERKDLVSRDTSPTQDLVNEQSIQVNKDGGGVDDYRLDRAFAYRYDFVEAIAKNSSHASAVDYNGNTTIRFFDVDVHADGGTIGAAVIHSPEGIVPRGENVGTSNLASTATNLPADFEGLARDTVYQVVENVDYSATADSATKTVSQRTADQDRKATMWVVPTFDDGGDLQMSAASKGIQSTMSDALKDFNANHMEWFADRGYLFESEQAIGLGDTIIEFNATYEHSPHTSHEGTCGIILPTATGNTKATSPYAIQLGNRGHISLFGGVEGNWYCGHGLTFNAYGKATVVLPAKEVRCAMPTGSQVKNLGPAQMATTSWQALNAGMWLHLEHPSTASITCSVGYRFFFKTKDRIRFDEATTESWLGKKWQSTTYKYSVANNYTPNTDQSALHTKQVMHTLCLQTGYHVSRWMRLTFGGAYTVAGKNAPQILEANLGCVIAF